jgi:hypothetical protein
MIMPLCYLANAEDVLLVMSFCFCSLSDEVEKELLGYWFLFLQDVG